MLYPTHISKEKNEKKKKAIHQGGHAALTRLFKKILPAMHGINEAEWCGNIYLKTELGLGKDAVFWPPNLCGTFGEGAEEML